MLLARALIVTLTLGILAAPPAAQGQPAKVPRIGVLSFFSSASPSPSLDAFRQALRELGWIEGQNIFFEYRFADARPERLSDLAVELVRLKVDVIFTTWGTLPALAAKKATPTIPIVIGAVGDPVAAGLVESLARPGGNVTGVSSLALELEGKRLELLKELVPKASRVAVFWNPAILYSSLAFKQEQIAAQALGVKLHPVQLRDSSDLEKASTTIAKERPDALLVHGYIATVRHRTEIADFAARNRLPAVYPLRHFVDVGGLLSYGASLPEIYKRAAGYIHKILKGAKPADLPVEQPTRFELVVNLKTAKALGLTIPPSILIRADQVIE